MEVAAWQHVGVDEEGLGVGDGAMRVESARHHRSRLEDGELVEVVAGLLAHLVGQGRPGGLVEFDVAAHLHEAIQAFVEVDEAADLAVVGPAGPVTVRRM